MSDDTNVRPAGLDLGRRRDTVEARHADIDDDEVGLQPLDRREGLLAIGRLANQFECGLHAEHSAQGAPRACAIVRDQQAGASGVGTVISRHPGEFDARRGVQTSDDWWIETHRGPPFVAVRFSTPRIPNPLPCGSQVLIQGARLGLATRLG
jgi:hypothetical protein